MLESKRQVLALKLFPWVDAGLASRGYGLNVAGEGFENAKCVAEYEFDSLTLENGMLQGTSNFFMSVRTRAGEKRDLDPG